MCLTERTVELRRGLIEQVLTVCDWICIVRASLCFFGAFGHCYTAEQVPRGLFRMMLGFMIRPFLSGSECRERFLARRERTDIRSNICEDVHPTPY